MYEIFKQIIDSKGLKAADVCRGTGLPSSFFSEWKRGKSKPKYDKIKIIAAFLNVPSEYLMTGIMPGEEAALPLSDYDVDAAIDRQYGHDVTAHVHEYVKLDRDDRIYTDGIIGGLLANEKYSAKEGSSAGAAT